MTCRALAGTSAVACAVAALAGCGGGDDQANTSGRQAHHAPRPGCQGDVRATLARLPGTPAKVRSRLVTGDEVSATCAYRAGGERLTVEFDVNPQAYMSYLTTTTHQVQANTGLGGAVPRSDYPRQVHHVGTVAAWLPDERQLVATNAPYRGGGTFVRVTIHAHQRGAPPDRAVGKLAARAALRSAPRGRQPQLGP
jgi:hypothetical protein